MGKPDRAVNEVVKELADALEETTGAKFTVVKGKIVLPAIVIGNQFHNGIIPSPNLPFKLFLGAVERKR